jgi:hypothetical protein
MRGVGTRPDQFRLRRCLRELRSEKPKGGTSAPRVERVERLDQVSGHTATQHSLQREACDGQRQPPRLESVGQRQQLRRCEGEEGVHSVFEEAATEAFHRLGHERAVEESLRISQLVSDSSKHP